MASFRRNKRGLLAVRYNAWPTPSISWYKIFFAESTLYLLSLTLVGEPALVCPEAPNTPPQQAVSSPSTRVCVIINGLGGTAQYEKDFLRWTDRLEEIFASQSTIQVHRIQGQRQGRSEMLQLFSQITSAEYRYEELWLFLVGHASHDGLHYRFNIRGPDLTDQDVREWLDKIPAKRFLVVAATSASGVLIDQLKGENRVIVTATRNQRERQPPIFFPLFLKALETEESDTDKDGRRSLLETFFWARRQVANWYTQKRRLQTEHPLLDDGGVIRLKDTDAETVFSSTLLASTAFVTDSQTGQLAQQKTALELQIQDLKRNKGNLSEADYFQKLEALLLELARLSQPEPVPETP